MQERIHDIYRPADLRKRDFSEVERRLSYDEIREQTRRCTNCGIPFCHGAGCPLDNEIPDINAAAASGDWREAWGILSHTSFFPEFTSRVCPALCEGSCTGGLNGESVMVRQIEKAVVERAFSEGWVKPFIPAHRTGKRAAVIGAGPSGLAAAEALNRAGHSVTVYEKERYAGGLLRYGIPDFKLAKNVIERRVALMREAGIEFVTGTEIGKDVSPGYLLKKFDFLVLALGTPAARDLKIPGRELGGIYLALDFLRGQNRVNGGELDSVPVSAKGKRVLVIGGGDTGSDCVGTAFRQGAASVLQIEIMPRPPEKRSPSTPWPLWPYLLRTSSSHNEGAERRWNVATKRFLGEHGNVSGIEAGNAVWEMSPTGKPLKMSVSDASEIIPADLVLLAMGFTGVPREGLAAELGIAPDPRGRLASDPERRIFAVGDCANGASLVVRAIASGKNAFLFSGEA